MMEKLISPIGHPITKIGGETTAHGFLAAQFEWPLGSSKQHVVFARENDKPGERGWQLMLYGPKQIESREGTRPTLNEAKAAPDPRDAMIKELWLALAMFVYVATHLSPQEQDGSHFCWIPKATLEQGRSALERSKP